MCPIFCVCNKDVLFFGVCTFVLVECVCHLWEMHLIEKRVLFSQQEAWDSGAYQ